MRAGTLFIPWSSFVVPFGLEENSKVKLSKLWNCTLGESCRVLRVSYPVDNRSRASRYCRRSVGYTNAAQD